MNIYEMRKIAPKNEANNQKNYIIQQYNAFVQKAGNVCIQVLKIAEQKQNE